MKQLRIIVSGRVQGVGFRWSAQRQAQQLGVNGYVRNLAGGEVEIVAAGADDRVERFVRWARAGPPGALVTDLQPQPLPYDGAYTDFDVRF